MADEERRITRVLIALDVSADEPERLDAAARLAEYLQAELQGLFVENSDLLRSAGLPFAAEIAYDSGVERPLSSDELARALRARAERSREAMARALRGRAVSWSFRTVQGRRVETALATASPADLLVVERSRRTGWQVPTPRRAPELAGDILLVYDGSDAARRGLDLMARIAARHRLEATILVQEPLTAEDEALRSGLQPLRERGVHPHLEPLSARTGALRDTLRQAAPDLALLPSGVELVQDPQRLERFAEHFEGTVVVLT